jgi:ABC-type glycerol-3-phosphate transport system permease component
VLAVMVFPVYWMVATAFKQGADVLSYRPQFLPRDPTLASFRDAIGRDFFWTSVRNSVIVVLAVVAISTVLAFLAALALAKFRFRGRRGFVVIVFAVQMVPLAALVIPLYIALSSVDQVWNEYIIAYVLLSSQEKQTVTIWLANITTGTQRGVDWGTLMAAATLTALPVVVFFVLVHRRIAFGLTAGAVKQ